MNRPSSPRGGGRWRLDPLWVWAVFAELVVLTAVVVVLISAFGRTGFWPWVVMAAAIVLGWVTAVVVFVPRSASDR
jgi:L-asparagine transporter-like permease